MGQEYVIGVYSDRFKASKDLMKMKKCAILLTKLNIPSEAKEYIWQDDILKKLYPKGFSNIDDDVLNDGWNQDYFYFYVNSYEVEN